MKRLHGLDALRGIASLVVAFHHLAIIAGRPGIPLLPFFAVDLFFVLSGFVMARTYEARLGNGLSVTGFVGLRYRRLFLPVAIGTTLGLGWRLATGTPPTADLAAAFALALAFLPAFWLANAFLFNVPAWSLFLEVAANGLHGLIFARLSAGGLRFAWAACALVFVGLLGIDLGRWGAGIGPIMSCFPRELACYLAGILIFRTWGDAPLGNRATFAAIGLVAGLSALVDRPLVIAATTLVAAPLLMRASLTLRGGPATAALGALSFPLYAVHVPVMHLCGLVHLPPAAALAAAVAGAAAIALTVERVRLRRQRSDRAERPSFRLAHSRRSRRECRERR